jgi:type II secretory pathway pseudopilin PulG
MDNPLLRLLSPQPMQYQRGSGAMPVMPQPQMQPQQMAPNKGMNFMRDLVAGALLSYGGAGVAPVLAGQQQRRRREEEMLAQQAEQQRQNQTAAYFRDKDPELAKAIELGVIDGRSAMSIWQQKQQGAEPDYPSSYREFILAQENPEYAEMLRNKSPATNVTVNNQGQPVPGDIKLRERLDTAQGDLWATYLKQGATSAQLMRDLDMMDELAKQAPQGPLAGRLAQAFPGFSSAGDAFNSIRTRVAPSLRVEGSGSTSDIEYAGMLNSLPALQNDPRANPIISQVMRQKAKIDVERAQIISGYQRGQIPAEEARARIAELDQRSIMTPEMKSMLSGAALPQGVTEEDIQFTMQKHGISREEVLRRLGQ